MDNLNSLSETEKLKLTVFNTVNKTCVDVGKNNTYIGEFSFTTDAKTVITELIWNKLEQYSEDLEAFAQHAKRNQINVEDLKLLFRRNPKIIEEINKLESEEAEKSTEKGKKRKRSTLSEVEPEDENT